MKVWICKGEVFTKRDLTPIAGEPSDKKDGFQRRNFGNDKPDRRGGDNRDRKKGANNRPEKRKK